MFMWYQVFIFNLKTAVLIMLLIFRYVVFFDMTLIAKLLPYFIETQYDFLDEGNDHTALTY